MFGIHGFTSASGARSAVLPAPVRRALLLAALVSGVLVTTWLAASDPVRAEENTAATNLVYRAGIDTDTGADAGEYAPASSTGLGEPLAGTVAAVGESTSRVVFDASDKVAPEVAAESVDVARQVRDAVHQVTAPVEEQLLAAPPATAPAAEERHAVEDDEHRDTRDRSEDAEAESVGGGPEPVTVFQAVPDTVGQHVGDTVAGDAPAPAGSDTAAHPALNTATSATPAPGATGATGATGGAAVAGYLPDIGAPAPAPGRLEAARHVLRSVPAESADEPTFSPD